MTYYVLNDAGQPGNRIVKRAFHLGDVLSVTTGRLVAPTGMDGVYNVLNYLTDDNLMTHQLPRAMDECAPHVLAEHPDLADVQMPDEFDGPEHVKGWLAEQVERYGGARVLTPVPPEKHPRIHPLAELLTMAPDKPVIVVEPEPTYGGTE